MKKIFFLPVLILLVLVACVAWGSWKTISALTPRAEFTLCDNGLEEVIDYQKYGVFQNEGKADYRYKITNRAALAAPISALAGIRSSSARCWRRRTPASSATSPPRCA